MPALTVPNRWPHVPLEAARIASPVASGVFGDMISQGAFLLGRNKAILGSLSGLPKANGTISLWYIKEPGDKALLVRVLLNEGAAAGASATVATSLRTTAGADTGVGTLSGTTSRLNGTDAVECSRTDLRLPTPHERVFDVSTLTVGTRYEIRVVTASSSGTAQGLHSLSAYVIPRDALDPAGAPTTEPGVSPPYAMARNPIFAGSATTAGDAGQGTERIIYVLDEARAKSRRWMQMATLQSDTYAWARTAAGFAVLDNWRYSGGAGDPRFTTRAKRLYGTSVENTLQAIVHYRTTNGAATGVLRIARESDAATIDVNLAGSTTYTSATAALLFATSDTDGEESWTFTASCSAGTLYIAGIAFRDNET
jgi:hypothetical protein